MRSFSPLWKIAFVALLAFTHSRVIAENKMVATEPVPNPTQADITTAEARLQQIEAIYKTGAAPQSELEDAQDQVALLRAERARDDDRVAKINLSIAERRLKRLTLLRKAAEIPQSDLEQAEDQVALSQAALTKDNKGVAAIRIKMAERVLSRIELLRKDGLIPERDLEEARTQVALLRKQAGISITTPRP